MAAVRKIHKGNPTLELPLISSAGEKMPWGFSFGVTKARTILLHLDDILKLVAESPEEMSKETLKRFNAKWKRSSDVKSAG